MKLTIRNARVEDAEGILAILNPIIDAGTYSALTRTFTVEEERDFICGYQGIFHVAVEQPGDRILGLQTLEKFAPYSPGFDHVGIIGTYVLLSEHGQGIGQQLSLATFEAAPDWGFEKIFTYVRADNESSILFYEKLGFSRVGVAKKQVKINGVYQDEVIIERFLGSPPSVR